MRAPVHSVCSGVSPMSESSKCRRPLTRIVTRQPIRSSSEPCRQWERIEGKELGVRRSGGHNAFMWFRGLLTMPARIGDFDLSKPAVAVLNVLVDDYAEVWINGQMPRRSGYPSPATIQGLNMPNRV